jgi:hypothetical protein
VPYNNQGNCGACPPLTACSDTPNVDGGDALFIFGVNSSGVVVHDLAISEFWDGIHTNGLNATIDAVTFDGNCDDGFSGDSLAVGTLVRNSSFLNAPDKCVQENGESQNLPPKSSNSNLRGYYNTTYENVDWMDCHQPLRISSQTIDGRIRLLNSRITGSNVGGTFTCDRVALSGSGYAQIASDSKVTNCAQGVILAGTMEANIVDSSFVENQDRGVATTRDAKVIVNHSLLKDNGKKPGGSDALASSGGNAGVSRRDLEDCSIDPQTGLPNPNKCTPSVHALVDLGGGNLVFLDGPSAPSGGLNKFKANRVPGARKAVDNSKGTVEGVTVPASTNCWDDNTPNDEIVGPVTTSGWLDMNAAACKQPPP